MLPAYYEGKLQEETTAGDSLQSGAEIGNDLLQSGAVGEVVSMRHPDVIVVDPPRKGCDEACLDTMLKMQPARIVYVSCDSATLARDLKILCDGGYELQRIRGVDQFANTVHVESIALLQRMSNTRSKEITLDVDMEDYHRIKSEGR